MNTSEHGYEALNGAFNPEALHCIKMQKEASCISRVCMGSHQGIHIWSTWSVYLEGHRPHLFLSKPNITAEITQEPIICLAWAQPGAKMPQFPVAWDFGGHCGWLSARFALSWDVEEAQPSPHLHSSRSVAKLSHAYLQKLQAHWGYFCSACSPSSQPTIIGAQISNSTTILVPLLAF